MREHDVVVGWAGVSCQIGFGGSVVEEYAGAEGGREDVGLGLGEGYWCACE